MSFSNKSYIGIDPSGGLHPFTYAAVDEDCQLIAKGAGEIYEVVAFLKSQQATVVAVNAPNCTNKGLVRKKLEDQSLNRGQLRGTDMRIAEYELRQRGISVLPTSSRTESCPAWIQMGFDLYRELDGMGYKPYPDKNASHQWLETNAHVAYCALLGQLPLPKPTLEGRMQRQLVLYEQDMGIIDPMEIFEEITRHRLLKGVLPMEFIYSAEVLDAMMATFIAYLADIQSGRLGWIGDKEEGRIVLPVPVLKEVYK
jgi:predicted nuclease with RNAse H fold